MIALLIFAVYLLLTYGFWLETQPPAKCSRWFKLTDAALTLFWPPVLLIIVGVSLARYGKDATH